jgi:hypothetical protein
MSKSFARRAVFLAVNFKFDDTSICTDDDRIVFFPEGAGTKAADGTTLLTEIRDGLLAHPRGRIGQCSQLPYMRKMKADCVKDEGTVKQHHGSGLEPRQ